MQDYRIAALSEKKENGKIELFVVFFPSSELKQYYYQKDGRPIYELKSGEILFDFTNLDEKYLFFKDIGNFVKFGKSGIANMDEVKSFEEDDSLLYFKTGGMMYIAKWFLKQNKSLKEILKKFTK